MPLKKISDVEYNGPKKTFTQELTTTEIKALLEGYEEIEFDDLQKGYHVRYFSKNKTTGKMEFKMGGTVIKMSENYLILSNGKINWSVQFNDTIFYKQLSMADIKADLERESGLYIKAKEKEIVELKKQIAELKKLNEEKDAKIASLSKQSKSSKK